MLPLTEFVPELGMIVDLIMPDGQRELSGEIGLIEPTLGRFFIFQNTHNGERPNSLRPELFGYLFSWAVYPGNPEWRGYHIRESVKRIPSQKEVVKSD